MIAMLHAIAAKVGADLKEDSHLKALSEETQPERLIEQIERGKPPKLGEAMKQTGIITLLDAKAWLARTIAHE